MEPGEDPLSKLQGQDEGMEDLTSHLGAFPPPGHHAGAVDDDDGLDLGDASEFTTAAAAAHHGTGAADPLSSAHGSAAHHGISGPLGLHEPSSPSSGSASTHHGFATYGQLMPPPSYEDSLLYESSGTAAGGSGGATASDPLSSGGGAGVGASSGGAGPSTSGSSEPGPILRSSPVSGIKLLYTVPPDAVHAPSGAASAGAGAPPHSPPGSSGGGGGGGGGPLVLALRPSQRGALLRITVSDPHKREQMGLFGIKNGFVSYLVTSTWGGPAAAAVSQPSSSASPPPPAPWPAQGKQHAAVRRRFRDFVALADVLKVRYRGYFVPPRPEKNAVEGQRMADGFVEERRVALERYMAMLAGHPVISRSEELALFLAGEGELSDNAAWRALCPAQQGSLMEGTALLGKQILGLEKKVLDPVQAAQPTNKASDPLRALKETAQSMQAVQRPPDEQALHRSREAAEQHKEVLLIASKAAEQLVMRMDKVALVQGDLGLALFKLASYEEAHGGCLAQFTGTVRQHQQLTAVCKITGNALVRLSRVSRTATGKTAMELGTLHEFLSLMPSIHKGLRQREKQLLTADTLQGDLEARQRQVRELEAAGAKVFGGDAARQRRVADIQVDISRLEMSIMAAKAEYERIKLANVQELSRVQGEMRVDFLHMLRMYAAAQAASSERMLEVWLQAAAELGAVPQELEQARAGLAPEKDA